ncbi:MAG: stage III sporulation protein AC [Ruminococcaceae bacterium]|nr:stage III sporulation protein AC [Oscillospiraceae bacterium]
MEVDLIFQIAAVGITVAVIYQLLVRAGREDQAMLISIMGLIVVMTMVITQIKSLFDTVKLLFDL